MLRLGKFWNGWSGGLGKLIPFVILLQSPEGWPLGSTNSMWMMHWPYSCRTTRLRTSLSSYRYYTSSTCLKFLHPSPFSPCSRPQSTWHFLLAYKSAVKGLPRSALVTEMLKNPELMRFAASLLPESIKGGYSHRTLINFHTATLVEYISRAESLDSGSAVVFLSNFLEPFEHEGSVPKDAIVRKLAVSNDPLLTRNSSQVLFCFPF